METSTKEIMEKYEDEINILNQQVREQLYNRYN